VWWWEEGSNDFKAWLESVFGHAIGGLASISIATNGEETGNRQINEDLKKYGHGIVTGVGSVVSEAQNVNDQHIAEAKPSGPTPTPAGTPSPNDVAAAGNKATQDAVASFFQSAQQASVSGQTQGKINEVDPNAPIYERTTKSYRPTPSNPRELNPVNQDVTRTLQDVAMDAYRWDDATLKKVAGLMVNAGYDKAKTMDRDYIAKAWAVFASTSAQMYAVGKKVSPMDLLKRQSFGLAGTGATGPKTTTSTSTNYTVTNATTAKQLAQAALTQRLGRQATDEEVSQFVNALHAEEKKNPTMQTTTTTTNAAGDSQSSTSTTRQGLDPNAFADRYAMNFNTEEAKAYQAAGIMMPWFFDALKAAA
jgi:hypothetical protein